MNDKSLRRRRVFERSRYHRRAVVAVWVAVTSTVLLGFAALSVDIGYMLVTRAELQNAADAAAFAGVSALADSTLVTGTSPQEDLAVEAKTRAASYGAKNKVTKQYAVVEWSDITIGHINNATNLQEGVSEGATPYNAVQVVVRKSPDSPNGPVNLFFASIWGQNTTSVAATATALLNRKVAGYRPLDDVSGPLLPLTVRQQKWIDEIVNHGGTDNFGYDTDTQHITNGSDGIVELSIYPEKEGPGNFGLLNINLANNGAPGVANQIRNGVTPEDLQGELGTSELRFYTDAGSPVTYQIEGTPGIKASLKDDFESRLGDIIGFLIHTDVAGQGSNFEYTEVAVQFGRLVKVQLTGSPNSKVIVIQPAVYTGREIIIDDDAPELETGGRLRLVR
jgi:Flp pilus assembly protein TadG